jgi:phage protein U
VKRKVREGTKRLDNSACGGRAEEEKMRASANKGRQGSLRGTGVANGVWILKKVENVECEFRCSHIRATEPEGGA